MKHKLLNHNGRNINEYPSDDWIMAPFPSEKEPIYCNDNLATANKPYFLEDDNFNEALMASKKAWVNNSRDISWRLHVFLWAASIAFNKKCEPTFVELGTGTGYMARGLSKFYKNSKFKAYLCDSFLPNLPNTVTKSEINLDERFSYCKSNLEEEELFESLRSSKGEFIKVKGVLPDILDSIDSKIDDIDMIHVDLNYAICEYQSVMKLITKLSKSIVLFDDTGAPGSLEQYEYHKRISKSLGKEFLILPTGQGLII